MSSPSLDCTWTRHSWNKSYLSNESFLSDQPTLVANPDVAGIGVLISFIGSGYMCWIILLVHYLLVYNPRRAGFSQHVNPIDALILDWFRKHVGEYSFRWGAGLEKCVLMLSDQQIVTGIAILGSAYSQLNNQFQLYHWQMSIWLAWFSSVTHLGTLTILRNYLREYPALRTQRLIFMLIIAIMLVVSLLPTGSPIWLRFPGDYAICYIQSLPASWKAPPSGQPRNNGFLAVSTAAIIVYSYLFRFIKMFHSLSTSTRTHLRVKPGRQVKRGLNALLTIVESVGPRWSYWTIFMLYNPFLVVFLIARAVFDLIESVLLEVLWLMYALVWASIRLFTLRQGIGTLALGSQENTWGFGQWVPTLLLVLPGFSIIEMCYEAWKTLDKIPEDRPEHICGVSEFSCEIEAHQTTPSAICVASEAGAATVYGEVLYQIKRPAYDENFYQYTWFCGLVLLLSTSIIATATIILEYAASTSSMGYFMGGALRTIGYLMAWFHVPPIFTYPFLFIRTGNSISIAECLVQKLFNKNSIKFQKRAFKVVVIVFLLLAQLVILMQFYYLSHY